MVTVAKKVLFILNILGLSGVFFSHSQIFAENNPIVKLLKDIEKKVNQGTAPQTEAKQ